MNDLALKGELIAIERYPDLGSDWRVLERVAHGSPFTTWAWISVWLRHLPAAYEPLVFRACDRDGVLALGLLVGVPEHGLRRLFGNRSIHLQETEDEDLDELTIEYAGLLVRHGAETQAYATLFDTLSERDLRWRRLHISASVHAKAICAALPDGLCAFSTRAQPCYQVDLAALRATGADYLANLSSGTRHILRKTRRAYETLGPVRAEIARDSIQALDWLGQLRVLHDRYWQSKGKQGSFASRFFLDFHKELVSEGSADGFTQLMRITAGPATIGYLYNIVWRKHAYFYNAGLNYGVLARNDRPGYLAQLLAIEKHLADGTDIYDFLAGDQQYKRSLGTHAATLHWIDIRPRGWRLALERLIIVVARRSVSAPLASVGGEPATHCSEAGSRD